MPGPRIEVVTRIGVRWGLCVGIVDILEYSLQYSVSWGNRTLERAGTIAARFPGWHAGWEAVEPDGSNAGGALAGCQ